MKILTALSLSLGAMSPVDDALEGTESMTWYETLTEQQKTNLKEESFELLTGTSYDSMSKLFSHEQLVKIAYDKLKIEGFDV